MRFWLTIFSFLLSWFGAALAWGQSIDDYVSVTKVPEWVVLPATPEYDPSTYNERDSYYEIADWQSRISSRDHAYFGHYAEVLVTAQGVEDNSNIEISFDPSHETIDLHFVQIRRDGKYIDKTDLAEFSIYRKETDRDKLLYNGTLQISYIVPDVRVGDMLEYAFTRKGKNPALGPHFNFRYKQEYNDVALSVTQRVLVGDSLPVYSKTFAEGILPQTKQIGTFSEYLWEFENETPIPVEDNLPAWYYSSPTFQLSSFENWSDVGRYFAPYYELPDELPRELQTARHKILNDHDSEEERLREALDYVQKNIRYLGIEIGEGGYIPRPVETVMENRFGDCKDMTLLLITLLKSMDIEAAPLLVDSDERGGFASDLPNHGAFDHVLVRAVIDGRAYIMDPTRGEQLGDLRHFQEGYFEKGVLVASDSPGVIEAEVSEPEFYRDFKETYDLVSEDPAILMTSSSTYFKGSADGMYSWYISNGRPTVEKSFLEYYQKNYPSIEQVGNIEINSDKITGSIEFIVNYKIPDGWESDDEEGSKSISIFASEISSDIPDFEGTKRISPYAIGHPVITRQILEFKVDDTWSYEPSTFEENNSAFSYQKSTTYENNIYVENYQYRSLQDFIPADEFQGVMTKISDIDDNLGVFLEITYPSSEELTLLEWGYVAMLFVAFLSLLFVVFLPSATLKQLESQYYYPVALPKFIVMSVASLGVYQAYWVFRNWKWVQRVQQEQMMPVMRAVFMVFTNFSLFPRLSASKETGYPWFKGLAIPIAVVYLIGNVLGALDDLSPWFNLAYLVPIFVMVPVAMQVVKLNEDRGEVIAENSKFGWPAILFISAWVIVWLMLIAGLMAT